MTTALERLIEIQATIHGMTLEQMRQMGRQRIPQRRFGEAQQVAAAALRLCSSPALFVNGDDLIVDGGRMRG